MYYPRVEEQPRHLEPTAADPFIDEFEARTEPPPERQYVTREIGQMRRRDDTSRPAPRRRR
jgi:hypothetical protein